LYYQYTKEYQKAIDSFNEVLKVDKARKDVGKYRDNAQLLLDQERRKAFLEK